MLDGIPNYTQEQEEKPKVFVYFTEIGNIRVLKIETHRVALWRTIYDNQYDYYFSNLRSNENLKNYTFKEFIDLSNEDFEKAVQEYATNRGNCQIVELE